MANRFVNEITPTDREENRRANRSIHRRRTLPDIFENWESEDDALMRRAAGGDTCAFSRLVAAHQQRVLRFTAGMLGGNADAAEDVTQETFLRLWRTRSTYRPEGKLVTLLLRITTNLCRDTHRSRVSTESLDTCFQLPSGDASPANQVSAGCLEEAVRDAVSQLPEGQRAVFILSHYEQLSYQEIADALGCPIGTVASRKHGAVVALRMRLRPWLEEKE